MSGVKPHVVAFLLVVPLLRIATFTMALLVCAEIRRDASIWTSAGLLLFFFTGIINNKTAIVLALQDVFSGHGFGASLDHLFVGGDIYRAGIPMWSTQWAMMSVLVCIFGVVRSQRGQSVRGVHFLVISIAPLFKIPWAVFMGFGFAVDCFVRAFRQKVFAPLASLLCCGAFAAFSLSLAWPVPPITQCSIVDANGVEHHEVGPKHKVGRFTLSQAISSLVVPDSGLTPSLFVTHLPWLMAIGALVTYVVCRVKDPDPSTLTIAFFPVPTLVIAPALLAIFGDRQNIGQFVDGAWPVLGLACYSVMTAVWKNLPLLIRRLSISALFLLCLPGLLHWIGQLRNAVWDGERFDYCVIEQERISSLLHRSQISSDSVIITNFAGPFHSSRFGKGIPSGIQDHVAAAGFADFCGNTAYLSARFSQEIVRRQALRQMLNDRPLSRDYVELLRLEGITHVLMDTSLVKALPTSLRTIVQDGDIVLLDVVNDSSF